VYRTRAGSVWRLRVDVFQKIGAGAESRGREVRVVENWGLWGVAHRNRRPPRLPGAHSLDPRRPATGGSGSRGTGGRDYVGVTSAMADTYLSSRACPDGDTKTDELAEAGHG